jgi:hypothetical protein
VTDLAQEITSFSLLTLGKWIWVIGAILMALGFTLLYAYGCRKFRNAQPETDERALRWQKEHTLRRAFSICRSNAVESPMTYGIFHPVILMPQDTDWDDENAIEYTLLHEYVHILHWDALAKLAATAALCLHWFNPAVWVLYHLFNRDIELACDEGVLRRLQGDRRAAYAYTLINMEEHQSHQRPLVSAFGSDASKERVVAIMKTKKTSILAAVCACVIVYAVAIGFGTSAKTTDEIEVSTADTPILSRLSIDISTERREIYSDTEQYLYWFFDQNVIHFSSEHSFSEKITKHSTSMVHGTDYNESIWDHYMMFFEMYNTQAKWEEILTQFAAYGITGTFIPNLGQDENKDAELGVCMLTYQGKEVLGIAEEHKMTPESQKKYNLTSEEDLAKENYVMYNWFAVDDAANAVVLWAEYDENDQLITLRPATAMEELMVM